MKYVRNHKKCSTGPDRCPFWPGGLSWAVAEDGSS